MQIQKSGTGYKGLSWTEALLKYKPQETAEQRIAGQSESDAADNALETTTNILFGNQIQQQHGVNAVAEASREIQDNSAKEAIRREAEAIKSKIDNRGIDPVALGIVKDRAEWDSIGDPSRAESIAKEAAIAHQKMLSGKWQSEGMKPATPARMNYDPQTMRDGRVMSSSAANEETRGRGATADPFKLDKIAKESNAHDDSVKSIRQHVEQQARARKEEASKIEVPAGQDMRSGRIAKSGAAADSETFVHRVPSNQVSMMDTFKQPRITSEELKTKMAEMFNSKVRDQKSETIKANEQRKEAIQGKKESDRSWEQVAKPASTAELQKRLTSLWIQEKSGEEKKE
jgi:hypothetical protein